MQFSTLAHSVAKIPEILISLTRQNLPLRSELKMSRSLQNQVLRRWILEDPAAVAALVSILGPEILKDLKNDNSIRPALEVVSEEVASQQNPGCWPFSDTQKKNTQKKN